MESIRQIAQSSKLNSLLDDARADMGERRKREEREWCLIGSTGQWCRRYIVEHCIERSLPGRPIMGRQGQQQAWQLFLRRALYDAEFTLKASGLLLELIWRELGDREWQLAGMESGAVPLLVALSTAAFASGERLNVFSVRKEPKRYGIFNALEGSPQPDVVTVLVDDFTHSGRSLRGCRNILEAQGILVWHHAFSLVQAPAASSFLGFPITSLYILADLGLEG
jgi:orotate phosphoribosyltransferase